MTLANGPAKARLTMLHPANAAIREETGLAPGAPDQKVKYLALSPSAKAREQKFIVAIVPQPADAAAAPPSVEPLAEPGALGVRVRSQGRVTEVYLNLNSDGRRMHLNSNSMIGGWETDAYLLALTRRASAGPTVAAAGVEGVARYFAVGCSYLRRGGQIAIDALSKVTAAIEPGRNVEVLLDGQPGVEVALAAFEKPAAVRVNGRPMTFAYESDRHTIRFRRERP